MRAWIVSPLLLLNIPFVFGARSELLDFGNLPPSHILWGSHSHPNRTIEERQEPTPSREVDAACTYGPDRRQCWYGGYNVAVDYDAKWPTTGVTRYVRFAVSSSIHCAHSTVVVLLGAPKYHLQS